MYKTTIVLSVIAIVLMFSLLSIVLAGNFIPHKRSEDSRSKNKKGGGDSKGGGGGDSKGGGGGDSKEGGGGNHNPSHLPTGGGEKSRYLKAYVEDCGQASSLVYNMEQLKNLEIIGLDFSDNCYVHTNNTLADLGHNSYTGKVFIHFDQTKGSPTCGNQPSSDTLTNMNESEANDVMSACYSTLKANIDSSNLKLVTGILWEQEANKFINLCASQEWCKSYWKKFGLEFAGWLTKFDFIAPLSRVQSDWTYAFYEYYNIYTYKCAAGKEVSGCEVDYNPMDTSKCFPSAQSGPNGSVANCGEGPGTVYCDTLTPSERGSWMAQILVDARKNNFPTAPDPDAAKKVIYFTFTTGSNPTFYQSITKATQFDEFVEAFFNTFEKAGVKNIRDYKIGVWGCPQWMGKGASTISFC